MLSDVDHRILTLGIDLPDAAPPAANYVPFKVEGDVVYVSGQLPMSSGALEYVGKIGEDFSTEQGYKASELCALNILAQLKEACGGDLNCIESCLKLTGFVNAIDSYTEHPEVVNGASDLMIKVFGEQNGRHARAAVGVASLPRGVAVEVEGIFKLKKAS